MSSAKLLKKTSTTKSPNCSSAKQPVENETVKTESDNKMSPLMT